MQISDLYSKKQIEYVLHANQRWNFKSGATRSGKTYIDTDMIIPSRIRERAGKEGLNVILGVTKETIERNVLTPMRDKFGQALVGEINNRNVCRLFGENAYCLGAEKVSQVSKIRGASFKYVYGDEVAEWNQEVFQLLKSRLDKPYSCFDGALNPEYPHHWLKKFLDETKKLYLQEYTIFDNPFLDPDFVKALCDEYEGTVYYDRYILGKWVRAEGAIYRRFADNPKPCYCRIVDSVSGDIGVKQILRSSIAEICIGVDFGGNKSGHAFTAAGKTRGYRELVALGSERHFGDYDSNDIDRLLLDFMDKIIALYGPIDYVYWDNAETVLGRGITRAIDEKFPQVIVRPAWKETVNDRIHCLNRLMGVGRFFYTEGCDTLKKALSEAVWNEKSEKDERLDDGSTDIDSLDSFEYTFERDMNRYIAG